MKYVIDICDEPINNDEGSPKLYKAKNFNLLLFDEEGLKGLTPYIEHPVSDNSFEKEEIGWNLARKILWGYGESERIKMFGNVDPKDVIGAYSYRKAKIVTDGYDQLNTITENVTKILEKRQQCLSRVKAGDCRSMCLTCECYVTNNEMIKALAYAIPALKED